MNGLQLPYMVRLRPLWPNKQHSTLLPYKDNVLVLVRSNWPWTCVKYTGVPLNVHEKMHVSFHIGTTNRVSWMSASIVAKLLTYELYTCQCGHVAMATVATTCDLHSVTTGTDTNSHPTKLTNIFVNYGWMSCSVYPIKGHCTKTVVSMGTMKWVKTKTICYTPNKTTGNWIIEYMFSKSECCKEVMCSNNSTF